MRYLLLLLLSIFLFCKNETPPNQLVSTREQPLREAPGERGREIRSLKAGEKTLDLREVSPFETPLLFDDTLLFAPWIKVETSKGEKGWVFAGYWQPSLAATDSWLLDKRLHCYFGKALTARYHQFAAERQISNDSEFAAHYREAMALRDTFALLLARRPDPNEASGKPDFFWLRDVLKGFVFQWVADGTQPYLFADFRFFQKIAATTDGAQDDAFVNTCLLAFPSDSIESFFPAWKFQLSEHEAASQLGTNTHVRILRQIDSALKTGSLFQPELVALKESLLEDILGKNTVYWQPATSILKEMEEILATGFTCLDDRDRTAIAARKTMFEAPEANGLRVNLRSGY
ncbi:MAG: SH3 domain-containing protein [Saprospiraceae bacterium]|nr:SH3 domain-containing protein [Saprospiraceae bacterium]